MTLPLEVMMMRVQRQALSHRSYDHRAWSQLVDPMHTHSEGGLTCPLVGDEALQAAIMESLEQQQQPP